MLKELLDAITAQAVAAATPREVRLEYEPDHVYGIITPNGELKRVETIPFPRNHDVASLDTIIDLAKRFAEIGDSPVAIWYSHKGIVLLIDDITRRDRAIIRLELSPQLQMLKRLEDTQRSFKQPEFRKLLRITFADCLTRSPNLPTIIGRVKFRVGSQTDVAISNTKVSVGRQLEAEVNGTDVLPEYVELDVPVFADTLAWARIIVKCALEADASTESFQLIPLAGEIGNGLTRTEWAIGTMLKEQVKENGVFVYHGMPS